MSWKSYDWRKSGCQIQSDTLHPEEKRNNWGSRISPLIEKLEPYIKPYITKIDDAVGQLQRQISQAVQKAGGVVDDTFRLEPIAGETIETLGKEIQSSLDVKEELQTVVADEVKTGIESGRTTVYTGPVGSQGGVYCGGYNIMQTFIKEPWKLDYQVISKSSLN